MVFPAREIHQFETQEECIFCHERTVDEFLLGKIYKYRNFIVHYFCLLFASNLQQNGKDNQGILGFLIGDIEKALRNKQNSICTYCRKPGALSVCAKKCCKVKFHFPCGVRNQSFHEFFGQFKSYCFAHRRIQVPRISSSTKSSVASICLVCQSKIDPTPSLSNLWATCCQTTWFHKDCIQRLALSAGYFFKCPNCNNQNNFRKEMLLCGIYIPDQDASWELEPNSFHELTERYSSCDADVCFCENGRKFSQLRGLWRVILCNTCGSQGIHNFCRQYVFPKRREWNCNICSSVLFTKSDQEEQLASSCSISTMPKRRSRTSLPHLTPVFKNVSTPQRKRRRRTSLPNNLTEFRERNRSTYYLRDLPRFSFAEVKRVCRRRKIEKTHPTKKVKCNIDGTEVLIPSAYKKLIKNFDIFLSDICFSRMTSLPTEHRRKRLSLPCLPTKKCKRYSMI